MRSVVYWRLWTAIVFLLEGMCVALAVQKPTKLAVRLMGFWKTESGVFGAQTSPHIFRMWDFIFGEPVKVLLDYLRRLYIGPTWGRLWMASDLPGTSRIEQRVFLFIETRFT